MQAHAQQLTVILRKELPALGYRCITPLESKAPIVTSLVPDMNKTSAGLKRAKVDASLSTGHMRAVGLQHGGRCAEAIGDPTLSFGFHLNRRFAKAAAFRISIRSVCEVFASDLFS